MFFFLDDCLNDEVCVMTLKAFCVQIEHLSGKNTVGSYSPVILWFDRDKIATEMIFAANLSEKPSKQHIQNRPKSDIGKYDYLHK